MANIKLPDDFVEFIRERTDNEGTAAMQTAEGLWVGWEKYGEAITYAYADEKGLEEPDRSAARGWMLKSLSGNIANYSYSTLCNRMRVARNVIAPGLHKEAGNEVVSYSVWNLLMRNLEHDDGLVRQQELQERLDWYFDNGMPTTRTIEEHVKSNGKDPEWKQLWDALVRNAKKLHGIPIPNRFYAIAEALVCIMDADSVVAEIEEEE